MNPFFQRGIGLYGREVERLNDPTVQQAIRNSPAAQAIKNALQQAIRNLKIVSDAGVQVAFGTDSGAANGVGLSVDDRQMLDHASGRPPSRRR
jgi:hypothetical protein